MIRNRNLPCRREPILAALIGLFLNLMYICRRRDSRCSQPCGFHGFHSSQGSLGDAVFLDLASLFDLEIWLKISFCCIIKRRGFHPANMLRRTPTV
ncbi:hypothetical protein BDV12DRAFT_173059 [Aspergillus spectabilis]